MTVVQYSDRTRAYKTRRPGRNSWNRESTGGPRIRTVDRLYILQADQAATCHGRMPNPSAQPFR